MTYSQRWRRTLALALGSALAAPAAFGAHPNFVEPEVDVLYSLFGEQAGDSYGWVADPIGDIDNDGTSDFITSAPFWVDEGGTAVGKIYVHSGADGALLFEQQGVPGEFLGYSATTAGDVNNDGTGDYIYGTRARVLVRSGTDHSLLHEWSMPGELFGFDVAGVGDLNGDSHDDVIVGAPTAAHGGAASGRLYAFSGADGTILWTFDGEAGWLTGLGTGLVGDVDDDGIHDVVVAAHGAVANGKGAAFVISGADGSALLELKSRSPAPGAMGPLTTFGRFHCHGAGDVNADGVPDIFVGDYNAKSPEPTPDGSPGFGTGRAYVYSGANGKILLDLRAEQVGDGLGPGRGVPDIDMDGHDDVYVAAYSYTDGAIPWVGKGYLVSGATGTVIRTMTGRTASEFLGVDALAVGDLDQDRITDYMLTGAGSLYIILGQ